jgi:hypothetical protein
MLRQLLMIHLVMDIHNRRQTCNTMNEEDLLSSGSIWNNAGDPSAMNVDQLSSLSNLSLSLPPKVLE